MLRERVAALQQELAEARLMVNTSVSQLQIEKTTQDQLLQQVKKIEDDRSANQQLLTVAVIRTAYGQRDHRLRLQFAVAIAF